MCIFICAIKHFFKTCFLNKNLSCNPPKVKTNYSCIFIWLSLMPVKAFDAYITERYREKLAAVFF